MTPPRYWVAVQQWWLDYNPTRREQYAIITALTLLAIGVASFIVAGLYGQLHY